MTIYIITLNITISLYAVKLHIGASRKEGPITHMNSVLLIRCISGGMTPIFQHIPQGVFV